MKSNVNRRTWLKQSAFAASSVMAGMAFSNELLAKPAFGMKPLSGKPSLLENYFIPLQDRASLKARLLANENPWGPSKKAVAAIAESASKGNRYVYNSSMKMVEVLATKEGVAKDNILLAAGSTDLLEKTAFALCMKGGNVISADPSYMSLVKTAKAIGATWKNIPLKADYSHDLDAMEKAIDAETKLIYVCNPNNPTGTITPIADLKAFCKRVSSKCPVFVDEAYLELMDDGGLQTTAGLITEGHDIIVCRTFSKIHGMAGLRVGYMIAKPERIKTITQLVRTEMGMSVTSIEGALASLSDVEFQTFTRTNNKINRDYTFEELKKAGLNPIPSYTNFILFPIPMPTKELLSKMMEKSVGIRGFEINGKQYGRVSIGTMDEMKLFATSLNSIIS
ncbi:MAG: histidinol-phosphate aminotransferase family protein [Chitinophagaceae bacterium]|nr:histidinol-phosphate aminotransferase family protein [Chitinophagaceae bacterium]